MNCCGKDRKRPIREISDPDSKVEQKRKIRIIPVIAVIAIAIMIYYFAG